MIGKIIVAVGEELKALFKDTPDSVQRDTQVSVEQMTAYTMPLIVYSFDQAPDAFQNLGGATMVDFTVSISCYIYDVNSGLDEDGELTEENYSVIDKVRRHFGKQIWLTNEFQDVVDKYNFRMVLNGMSASKELQKKGGGIIPGYSINFDSVALDLCTDNTEIKDFETIALRGITLPEIENYILQRPFLGYMTTTVFADLTMGVVDGYYLMSDTKKLRKLLSIDETTHKPETWAEYAPVKNMILFSEDNINTGFLFDGTNWILKTFEITWQD